jgi:hypothetical protein
MNRFAVVLLLCLVLSAKITSAQSPLLNDSQIAAAIEEGHKKKDYQIGLTLLDHQTALRTAMSCVTCGESGYTVKIYTPLKWIEHLSQDAKKEMKPFTLADVTPEMRTDVLRVVALPSKAAYITGRNLAGSSSVHRVVLTDKEKATIIQPVTNENGNVEDNSAYRSVSYTSAFSSFAMKDVDSIRGDDNGEFFVVVVGDNQNKYFKVKTRMFKQLF